MPILPSSLVQFVPFPNGFGLLQKRVWFKKPASLPPQGVQVVLIQSPHVPFLLHSSIHES